MIGSSMCSPMSAKSMISSRLSRDSRSREPSERAGEVDVVASRVLGMEAAAQLEQRADAAVDAQLAARRAERRPR